MTRLFMTTDGVGGVWQYATDIARALKPLDYDVTLAVLGPPLQDSQRAGTADLQVLETGLPLEWLAHSSEEVAEAALEIARLSAGYDVVQLNTPALGVASFSSPVIAVAHSCVASWWAAMREGPLPPDFQWRAAMTAAGLKRANKVITPSAAFSQIIQQIYALPARPDVVHNGRNLPTVEPCAMGDFAITAGRLWDPAKGAELLDQVANRLGVPFLAAGPVDGPNGEALTFENLRLLGQVDEAALMKKFAGRPVFVSAARYEPFGLAVLEAASAGCPLVLSDIPTFRELWEGAAHFVPPDDVQGFATAVEDLIADMYNRIEAGERARQRASRYTASAMAHAMTRHYAEASAMARKAA